MRYKILIKNQITEEVILILLKMKILEQGCSDNKENREEIPTIKTDTVNKSIHNKSTH